MEFTDRQRENFAKHFIKSGIDDCWEWTACVNHKGYGIFAINRKTYLAHRIAFMMPGNKIPEGMFICHTCDNRRCVNPNHLWVGTPQTNMDDMIAKGRAVHDDDTRGEANGHAKLTNEKVLEIRAKRATGKYTLKMLSKEYGVVISTIANIASRTIWKHI